MRRKDDPNTFGVVLVSSPLTVQCSACHRPSQRCWQDAEDLPAAADNVDPLMRPLVQVRLVMYLAGIMQASLCSFDVGAGRSWCVLLP